MSIALDRYTFQRQRRIFPLYDGMGFQLDAAVALKNTNAEDTPIAAHPDAGLLVGAVFDNPSGAVERWSGFFQLPTDWDRKLDLLTRVWFLNGSAAGNPGAAGESLTFSVSYNTVRNFNDLDTESPPVTQLNTLIPQFTFPVGAASGQLLATGQGKIIGGSIPNLDSVFYYRINSGGGGTDDNINTVVLGLEIEYSPKYSGNTSRPQRESRAWQSKA